ncbi:GPR1/FUN34/yaaH family-domain-containing protein, partial [Dissophora ornata]
PAVPVPVKINPGPLGLSAFALTTFVLSLFNLGAGVPSGGPVTVVTGLALFYGGLTQILAGMWEFKVGNNFGATAFTSYGAFWLSYAAILIPGFGIVPAYANAPDHTLDNALGIFLLGWGIFTFMLWIATVRSTMTLSSMFFILTITFFVLSSAHLSHLSAGNLVTKIGGALGLVTAFLAWYNAAAGLYDASNTFVKLPTGSL